MIGLPSFGVRRPVVANLVMFAIVAAGLVFGGGLTREFFPETRPNQVIVRAPYPGASPEEVEDALAIKIEDALVDLDDVEEISTTIGEGIATVVVEYEDRVDIDAAVAEIKREVDALQDLPEGADRIVVAELEPTLPAIVVSLYGEGPERAMKRAAREIRDDLRSIAGMGEIVLGGVRNDEITVEVSPEALLEHRLSMTEIAERISAAMRELPGGSVRGQTASVSLRSVGTEERAAAVREIVVKADPGGDRPLRLGEIAEVTEGFADTPVASRLFGRPAVNLTVQKTGDDDIVEIAELVKAYVAGRKGEDFEPTWLERLKLTARPLFERSPTFDLSAYMPRLAAHEFGASRRGVALPGELTTTTDLARFVVGRLDLLTRNALFGGILVFATLVVLLNWRISFWVAAGLIISLLGTLVMMRFSGITLNLLTMFGLIVVIGILVDDAIVVAENIAARHEAGEPALAAAVRGSDEVAWPVVATVLTTICAFAPLGLIEGRIGDILGALPAVVAVALLVSLIESLFILPSHMGHSLKHADKAAAANREGLLSRLDHRLDRFRRWFFDEALGPRYDALLRLALRRRYSATAIAVAMVVASAAIVAGGRVEFIFFEANDAETVTIDLRMPVGTSLAQTDEVLRRIEAAVDKQPQVTSYFTSLGEVNDVSGGGNPSAAATNTGQLVLELEPVENRPGFSSERIINNIRDEIGVVPGVKSLRIQGVAGGPDGAAFSYNLVGEDQKRLDAAAAWLMDQLRSYDGVVDISSDSERGQRELRVTLREGATALGFTRASLGSQVQGFVFGIEAFTFAGEREDVDIRVQMPTSVRRSLAEIERQHVFTPGGDPVPLAEVAHIEEATGYSTIRRFGERERPRRVVAVNADIDRGTGANPEEISANLAPSIREIPRRFPGVEVVERGRQKDVAEAFATLPLGFMAAAGMIYVILAWLFGSYTQPLIVMSAIPFALIGMIWGHVVVGYLTTGRPYAMTFLSLIGFVALAGVVVNDSLIFMEFYNSKRREGLTVRDAALAAGRARLRAILLTTITTVFGLLPLMLERSFQARFLIPMAITIAAGLISATGIILLVLPCLLVIVRDVHRGAVRLWTGAEPRDDDRYVDPAEEFHAANAQRPVIDS